MKTTVGQLIVNEDLPEDLRDYQRTLGAAEADKLLADIAKKYPERYKAISHALVHSGASASFQEGATLSLADMISPVDRAPMLLHVRDQTKKILADKTMPEAEKKKAIEGVYSQVQKHLVDTTFEAAKLGRNGVDNAFATQVMSRARGTPAQLAAMMTTPGLYTDAHDEIIPVFIERSYAEGLRPHEYWAGTYGARKSVISTKFRTAEAGYLGKQFNHAAMRTVVTDEDCGTAGGIPVGIDDLDSIGAMLARKAGPYAAGTLVSKEVLENLKDKGLDKLVVRSPLTCSMGQGVCKHCVGLRENGKLPNIGDHVGINAASALAERIAQSSLSIKHGGGMAKGKGESSEKVYAGFDVIENLFQVPKTFPNRASIAEEDGRISKIEAAPQGGMNVYVNDTPHYVNPAVDVTVKDGDFVEAGDQLSTGILNPREIVQYKGLGEGRRYFTERAVQAFRDTGYPVQRRNMELLVRGMLDSAVVHDTEGLGDYLPEDVVAYSKLAASYKPRKDAQLMTPDKALGRYLEEPVLHYSLGTRITHKVAKDLQSFGHDRIMAHASQPNFEAYMPSLREAPQYDEDWMAQLGTSYLKSTLLENVHRGAKSELHGLHPVPGLAKGTEFGQPRPGTVGY